MLDITSPKVVTPALLFAILSPGVLLQLPDTKALMTGKMSRNSVYVHAVVFALLYKVLAKYRGLIIRPADLIVPTVLFVLLSPGMILSLPSNKISSGQTSLTSVIIHTLVFMIVYAFLRKTFPQYY